MKIGINFMICFNLDLDYIYQGRLPPLGILDIALPHNFIFQLTSHYLLGFSSS